MKLGEIMTSEVETITPEASLQQAAQMMASLEIGSLPVMIDDGLVGVITDRDMTVRAAARGLDPKKTAVRDVMTEAVVCGVESQDVQEGARLMMNNRIRRLPILDRNKKLVGIVSLGDLSKTVDDKRLVGQALERISETGVPEAIARA